MLKLRKNASNYQYLKIYRNTTFVSRALTHQLLALRRGFTVVVLVLVVVGGVLAVATGCRWLAGRCLGRAFGEAELDGSDAGWDS